VKGLPKKFQHKIENRRKSRVIIVEKYAQGTFQIRLGRLVTMEQREALG